MTGTPEAIRMPPMAVLLEPIAATPMGSTAAMLEGDTQEASSRVSI